MNISEVSERLAHSISTELDYSEEKKEIVAYGIESTILAAIGFIAVVLLAIPFNAMFPAAIAAISGGTLRKLSGGAHFNNPAKCLAFGTVVYCVLGITAIQVIKLDLYNSGTLLFILVIASVIIGLLSPVDSEAKPIHSPQFRQKLKIASIGFIIFAFLVVLLSSNYLLNTSAVLGTVYQTMTLLPVFNKKKKEVSV